MEPVIEVSHLVAGYGGRTILEDVSMAVFRGEVMVILGGSGCGKTTLLRSIVGLATPTEGAIRLFGRDVLAMDEPEFELLLRRVGLLFQNGALLNSLSVGQNIALPLEQHTRLPAAVVAQIVRLKLSLVELAHAENLYPGELSGGMRKRAALARAMALDPEILFCDEPSAGLDPVTAAGLDQLILKLKRLLGMTIVVVTHELESIRTIADRVTMLDRGRCIFHGPMAGIDASDDPVVRAFFDRRAESRDGGPTASLHTHLFPPE